MKYDRGLGAIAAVSRFSSGYGLKIRLFVTFLEDKSSIFKDTKFPMKVGMLPVILFSDRSNKTKLTYVPKKDGIVPANEFP